MLRTKPCDALTRTLICVVLAMPATALTAQTTPATSTGAGATAAAARILGTVTAVKEGSITVQQEGANTSVVSVAITPQTRLLRTAPGEKNLKNATPMQLTDLAVGDRVLIRPTGESTPDNPSAGILIAMKQGDISQAHAEEAADWQKRGVTGIVATLDADATTITLRPQAAAASVVIHTTKTTIIRHYAADSTSFADTRKVAFSDIHAGDQLRARGAKDEAGNTIAAEEIVAGSFRNIAGTILGIDASANTISLTDLATKRPVTLHIAGTTQLRKLPPEMATRIAHREAAGAGAAAGGGATPAIAHPRTGGGEMAGMLQRAPTITLTDLKKGDAVMIVASDPGAAQQTAITVIAGVEPLLQASPEASAGLFSASWNLGGGGADAAGADSGSPR